MSTSSRTPNRYTDITLTCCDCRQEFTFTAGEQEFFAQKNLRNQPKRCKDCRDKKKQDHGRRR